MTLIRRKTGAPIHVTLTNLIIEKLEEFPNTVVEIEQVWNVIDIGSPGRYTFGQVKTCLVWVHENNQDQMKKGVRENPRNRRWYQYVPNQDQRVS